MLASHRFALGMGAPVPRAAGALAYMGQGARLAALVARSWRSSRFGPSLGHMYRLRTYCPSSQNAALSLSGSLRRIWRNSPWAGSSDTYFNPSKVTLAMRPWDPADPHPAASSRACQARDVPSSTRAG
jgi:hypothetical protein